MFSGVFGVGKIVFFGFSVRGCSWVMYELVGDRKGRLGEREGFWDEGLFFYLYFVI